MIAGAQETFQAFNWFMMNLHPLCYFVLVWCFVSQFTYIIQSDFIVLPQSCISHIPQGCFTYIRGN